MSEKEDKFDHEKIYKELSICEYNKRISQLRKIKLDYMKKAEDIQHEIKKIDVLKKEFCRSSLEGHTFRTIIEDGPYGERYRVCSICGLEV